MVVKVVKLLHCCYVRIKPASLSIPDLRVVIPRAAWPTRRYIWIHSEVFRLIEVLPCSCVPIKPASLSIPELQIVIPPVTGPILLDIWILSLVFRLIEVPTSNERPLVGLNWWNQKEGLA